MLSIFYYSKIFYHTISVQEALVIITNITWHFYMLSEQYYNALAFLLSLSNWYMFVSPAKLHASTDHYTGSHYLFPGHPCNVDGTTWVKWLERCQTSYLPQSLYPMAHFLPWNSGMRSIHCISHSASKQGHLGNAGWSSERVNTKYHQTRNFAT
jgi:hypothetical protein